MGRISIAITGNRKGLHNYAYPRTDPVIIMGILDRSGEKMLMGRQVCGVSLFQSIQAVQVFRAGRDFSLENMVVMMMMMMMMMTTILIFGFPLALIIRKLGPRGWSVFSFVDRKRLKRTDRVPGFVV
jgi:hypothetical protein